MSDANVTRAVELEVTTLTRFFARYGLRVIETPADARIPGSYWGECEAGLLGSELHLRADTPVHSALHEACHYLCMDASRRSQMDTDAGGSDTEENAVCYLQCVLADALPGYSQARCFADMDAWGYHFLLGSAQAWFEHDSKDAQAWLHARPALRSLLVSCADQRLALA